MLDKLRDVVVASVRLRASQGDCPTEPAHSVEVLEQVIVDLTDPSATPAGGGKTARVNTDVPHTFTSPDAAPARSDDLAWLSNQHRLSLDYYSPWYGDDDDQSEEWRVSRESGPINDREWEIVGRGATAAAAIASARAALDLPAQATDQ